MGSKRLPMWKRLFSGSRSSRDAKAAAARKARSCQLEQLEPIIALTASPTGPNILVPTTFVNTDQADPQVAKAANGNFVVVWEHESAPGTTNNTDIYFRLFNADGSPRGSDQVLVNSSADEQDPRVAMAPDGQFVIAWEQRNSSGVMEVWVQQFNAAGTTQGSAQRVNVASTTLNNSDPDIAMKTNGDFVVVWNGELTANGVTSYDVLARRFRANGTSLDNTPIIIAQTPREDSAPRVATPKTAAQDTFVVTWTSLNAAGDYDIWRDVRNFGSGQTISGGANVTDSPAFIGRDQYFSDVDMDDNGNFVVSWIEEVSSTNRNIYFRRYEADGDPVTQDRQDGIVSTSQDTTQASIAVAGTGYFIISFTVNNGTGGSDDIRYQMFTSSGVLMGITRDPVVPGQEPGDQNSPAVAMNSLGEFTIVWQDDFVNAQGDDVYARNYRHVIDTVGLYDPGHATFYLRNENSAGAASINPFQFGVVTNPSWIPLEGDWNGDGITTIGLYDTSSAMFYLRNSNSTGVGDIGPVNFGVPGWVPLAGDWDGDGITTIGLYDPASARFYMRNSNTSGVADITFVYGRPNWVPVVGDWDGDGRDSVAVYNPQGGAPFRGRFFLRNELTTGTANRTFDYGAPNLLPFAGDWNRDGIDEVGVYNPGGGLFFLRQDNGNTVTSTSFNYGPSSFQTGRVWRPMFGDWNGPGSSPLMYDGQPVDSLSAEQLLTDHQLLEPLLAQAIGNWAAAGLHQDALNAMLAAEVVITDLQGGYLAHAHGHTITLDFDAAGAGWFIDATPGDSAEFEQVTERGLVATSGAAAGGVDLLTVLEHELGHLVGLGDLDADEHLAEVMAATLAVGTRRSATAAAIGALYG